MTQNDKWAPVFFGDEIGIRESQCKCEDDCSCHSEFNSGPRCFYSTEDVKSLIEKYYRGRAEYVRTMEERDFVDEFWK